jgi:hypothetical protein
VIFQAKISSSVTRPVTVEDICPVCKKPTNPDLINSSYFPLAEDETHLVLTFRCLGCKHFWTEEFIATRHLINSYTERYEIEHIKVIPNLPTLLHLLILAMMKVITTETTPTKTLQT